MSERTSNKDSDVMGFGIGKDGEMVFKIRDGRLMRLRVGLPSMPGWWELIFEEVENATED